MYHEERVEHGEGKASAYVCFFLGGPHSKVTQPLQISGLPTPLTASSVSIIVSRIDRQPQVPNPVPFGTPGCSIIQAVALQDSYRPDRTLVHNPKITIIPIQPSFPQVGRLLGPYTLTHQDSGVQTSRPVSCLLNPFLLVTSSHSCSRVTSNSIRVIRRSVAVKPQPAHPRTHASCLQRA